VDVVASMEAEATLKGVPPIFALPSCEASEAEMLSLVENSAGRDIQSDEKASKKLENVDSIEGGSDVKRMVLSSIKEEESIDLLLSAELDSDTEQDENSENRSANSLNKFNDKFLPPDEQFCATVDAGGDNPSKVSDQWAMNRRKCFRESRKLNTKKSLQAMDGIEAVELLCLFFKQAAKTK
jgi:hypothetical protein